MFNDNTACSKCAKIPQYILMTACNHDLCLDCSADRLALQFKKKKKQANSIVCQICKERTILDSDTIVELQKIINKNPTKIVQSPKVEKKVKASKINVSVEKKKEVAESHILGSLPAQLNLSKETLVIFAREKIDTIETLALLTEEDYKELKIPMGERKRLMKVFNK